MCYGTWAGELDDREFLGEDDHPVARMTRPRSVNALLRRVKTVQWQGKRPATSTTTPLQVFNSETKRHQRDRAARLHPEHSRQTDYLRDEVAQRLIERFMVVS